MKICKACGAHCDDAAQFCTNCGQGLGQPVPPVSNARQAPTAPVYSYGQPAQTPQLRVEQLPPEYRPLGAWKYWALSLLYAVPIVGFVFIIVFSINRSNINRRNFTRSYLIWLIMSVALLVLVVLLGMLFGFSVVRRDYSWYW